MAISTDHGPTPWTTGELAALHRCAGPRAKRLQTRLDRLVCDVLAPHYVAAGMRARDAAVSILAACERLTRIAAAEPDAVRDHVAHLVRLAYDRDGAKRLDAAAKRFPRPLAGGRRATTSAPPRRRARA